MANFNNENETMDMDSIRKLAGELSPEDMIDEYGNKLTPDIAAQRKEEKLILSSIPDIEDIKKEAEGKTITIKEGKKHLPVPVRAKNVQIVRSYNGEVIEANYQERVYVEGFSSTKGKINQDDNTVAKKEAVDNIEFEDDDEE